MMEWSEICLNYPWLGVPVWDETLINVLLWKKGGDRTVVYLRSSRMPTFPTISNCHKDYFLQPPYDKWFMFHGE